MFSKFHKKAVAKKDERFYLKNVFYSAENKEFVSCNGHILLVEKTEKDFHKNIMFNPATCFPCFDQKDAGVQKYPNYRLVIPDSPAVNVESYKIFKRKKTSRVRPAKVIFFNIGGKQRLFDKKLIDIALSFVSETGEYNAYAKFDGGPLVFKSNNRTAVISQLKGLDSKDNYCEIASGKEYSPMMETTKTTTIFIATNKKGEIVGAFSDKNDADTAADDGLVVETLFVKKG